QLCGTLGEGVLVEERQGQWIVNIDEISERLESSNALAVHIIVDAVPILSKETEIGNGMLSHVSNRNDQERTCPIGDPGVVTFHVGLARWEIDPRLRQLVNARTMGQHQVDEAELTFSIPRAHGRGVTGLEQIGATVIGEKEFACVEA